MHLLIIEDEELDVIALQRAFTKHNVPFNMTVARNGAEALHVLRGTELDQQRIPGPVLILLDVNMPRMNGIEFLKVLRADPELKQLPVFMLTTSDEERDVNAAYNLGISGYLLKQDIGEDCEKLIQLINAYADVVHFPEQ
ncbi:response regulator [Thalassoglobus polymorphus]|uniref:Response regulator rcp1 n=1 Tax=Thalassoglobus polymorphus TaxID=2527994 RepID=A0A517QTJ6_9PLAN|nr:response regulator [Thalassoglobus polymorphus]QDT34959.1 Response regulator rcp1 [Thalassoglobus polymorphus]